MGDNKNLIIGIVMFILGGFVATTSNLNNSSNAENNVTINQENPGNFEKNSKKLKNFEKKVDINNASKFSLMELDGIGSKKADDIINNRPYDHPLELLERNILGYYSYENNKEIFKVGD